MKRIVAMLLMVTMAATGASASTAGLRPTGVDIQASNSSDQVPGRWLLAQATSLPPEAVAGKTTSSDGMLDGQLHAERIGTGGNFAGGLAIGVLTGLIGTGIGYFIVGSAPLDARARQALSEKPADYRLGFETGWQKKTKSKKRGAFLGGGILGTLAFVVLYASSQ